MVNWGHKLICTKRQRLIVCALTAGVGLLCWIPGIVSEHGGALDRLSYDVGCRFASAQRINELQMIDMDLKSFQALHPNPGSADLWDRGVHARLLRKLTKDGAKVILFDVVFAKAAEGDQDLADAIRSHGKVVIGAELSMIERGGIAGIEPVFPVEILRRAAAAVGMTTIQKDPDGAVRRHFSEAGANASLPRAAAQLAGAAALANESGIGSHWMRYYGSTAESLPRMRYVDALEQPEGIFRDKFVIIGSNQQTQKPGAAADYFRTPFSRWSGE